MNYRSIRSAEFDQVFQRLPQPVAHALNERIRLLEQNPRAISRPAFTPLPSGQVMQLEVTFQGMEYLLDVIFKYGSDEETLHLEYLFVETV